MDGIFFSGLGFLAGLLCSDLQTWHIMGGGRREMNCNWDNGTLESDETTDDVGRVWEVMNLGDVASFFIFVAFGGGGLLEKYMRMVLVVFARVFWSSAFFLVATNVQ